MIRKTVNLLTEFSIPLICGVFLALIFANLDGEYYRYLLQYPLLGEGAAIFGHKIDFDFLINDVLMVFFFGIATVEIVQSVLPGGSLNPMTRAVNPLFSALGGIVAPIAIYFLLCLFLNVEPIVQRGWAIPTATDIALAWLVARFIFGERHPAVSFLLLLAVADDAVGLGIIAIFYPDPSHPVELQWLGLILIGMAICYVLHRYSVRDFWWYLLLGGLPSWAGLILAHLHPALALVFIIPFMPAGHGRHYRLFVDEPERTTLTDFEHFFKTPVDIGLFGFGLANAGVPFSNISSVTWIVFTSLIVGKTVGITAFSYIAHLLGFHLPRRIDRATLVVTAMIAGIGLTVALFMAGVAFVDGKIGGAAKMGALFSGAIALIAYVTARMLGIRRDS